jgi:hypothetical protein
VLEVGAGALDVVFGVALMMVQEILALKACPSSVEYMYVPF